MSHRCYKGLIVNRGYGKYFFSEGLKVQTSFIHFFDLKGCNICIGTELVLAFGELVEAVDPSSGTVVVAKITNTAYYLFSIAYLYIKKKNHLIAGATIGRSRESVFKYVDILFSIFGPQF